MSCDRGIFGDNCWIWVIIIIVILFCCCNNGLFGT